MRIINLNGSAANALIKKTAGYTRSAVPDSGEEDERQEPGQHNNNANRA